MKRKTHKVQIFVLVAFVLVVWYGGCVVRARFARERIPSELQEKGLLPRGVTYRMVSNMGGREWTCVFMSSDRKTPAEDGLNGWIPLSESLPEELRKQALKNVRAELKYSKINVQDISPTNVFIRDIGIKYLSWISTDSGSVLIIERM